MSLQLKAAESQVFPETNKLDDPRQDDVEPKRRLLEKDADDEDQEQIKQNDTYELQETHDEALISQTGGEEGDAETGQIVLDDEVRSEAQSEREPLNREKLRDDKDDKAGEPECERIESHDKDGESDRETSQIREMTTDGNCRTASEGENSVSVEVQDNQDVNPDRTPSSITQEKTRNKSEEVKENEVDDASVNGEEQSKSLDEGRQNISLWQRIRNNLFRCIFRNNAEDEGQMRKIGRNRDRKKKEKKKRKEKMKEAKH